MHDRLFAGVLMLCINVFLFYSLVLYSNIFNFAIVQMSANYGKLATVGYM